MVYELKSPVDDSPGLLMFTHKERSFFIDPPDVLRERLRRLTDQYVFGMQWGRYHSDVGDTPFIDFHMACPGTVDFRADTDIRHIPLCSRNFTPSYFRPMDIPIEWDVLSVGHPITGKRYADFLDVLRMVLDAGVELRVLLICAVPDDPATLGAKWDHAFFEKYESLFTDAERELIDLAVPGEMNVGSRPIHPLPNQMFPYLYNAANCFTLFSQEEGQSKVIHEALLCGTPVIVREDLKGGGRDYLDEKNSRQFGSLSEACDIFIDIVNDPDTHAFDPTPLRAELAEEQTADRLEDEIKDIYADLGHEYAGEMEKTDLAFKLGSHTITLPKSLRNSNTNDLRSPRAMGLYIDSLLGQRTPLRDNLALQQAALDHRLSEGGVAGLARPVVRLLDRQTSLPVYQTTRRLYRKLS